MKKIVTIILISCLGIATAFAAKNSSIIKGKVIDGNSKEPLAFATVSLHHADSTILGGATTELDGTYIIKNVPFGEYTLRVSFIGYKEHDKSIVVEKTETSIDDIIVEEDAQTLASAVISERRPVIEQKLDKLIMNVAEAVSTQGSNGIDILRKAPGVSIDSDGNVKLNGLSVDVWIDGRPSYLSGKELEALLLSTDGNTIDKIEIMAHPSSKYDAAGGGGIINIKTKKNFMKGFNGSLSGTYGGMYFDRYVQDASGTVNLNYRGEKTNTFFTYSPRMSQKSAYLNSFTSFGEQSDMTQTSETKYLFGNSSHSFKLGNDFFANKKNVFGFIVSSMLRNGDNSNYGDSFTDTYKGTEKILSQKSQIKNNDSFDNITANLNYTHTFDETTGKEMTANADYAYYDLYDGSYQENIYVDPITKSSLPAPVIFSSDGRQYINIYSAKLDYEQLFWKTGRLEAGAKWAMTNTDNNTLRKDMINGQWVKNDGLSSLFNYNEQVTAAYASIAKMFGQKWVTKVGIRAEHTYSRGDWKSANNKSSKSYINFFPTVYIGYNPSQSLRYSLSYTLRINRPSFGQLNPQRTYIDANSSVQGNPNIAPQFTDQLMLGVGVMSYFNVSALYMHTRDLIMQNPTFDNKTGDKLLTWGNFGVQDMMGLSLSISELPVLKWLIFNASGFGAYNTNRDYSGTFSNNGMMYNAYGNLSFLLPKDWKIEFGGWFQSGLPFGYFRIDPMYSFFGGIKKNLFNDKATLTINVNDIFRTQKSNVRVISEDNVSYALNQSFNVQKVKVTFMYRFGNVKATKKRNVGNIDEAGRVGGSSSVGGGAAASGGGL